MDITNKNRFQEAIPKSQMTMTEEMSITDTLEAKVITILEDYYEHDADLSAECATEIVKLIKQAQYSYANELIGEDEKEGDDLKVERPSKIRNDYRANLRQRNEERKGK